MPNPRKSKSNKQPASPSQGGLPTGQAGFTLIEILVSTVIFTVVVVAMLSLFNYVLKINRRSEALRQASQGSRDFIEFLVKEIRNGQIDYYVANGTTYTDRINPSSPCSAPGAVGSPVTGAATYSPEENKLGLITTEGQEECFYYGDTSGSYVGNGNFASPSGTLVLQKYGITSEQILNPPNFRVDSLKFIIRPICDPYTQACLPGPNWPQIQPSVNIFIKFEVLLPTGEQVPIYYQSSVSSNLYDVPSLGSAGCPAAPGTLTGLVGYWKFDDDPSSLTAKDSTGFTNDGTLINGPVWTSGKYCGGLTFDGVDDYAEFGAPSQLDFATGSFTYSFWVKQTTQVGTNDIPFSKGGGCIGCTGWDMEFAYDSVSNTYGWGANLSDGSQNIAAASYQSFNQWILLTTVVDRANGLISSYENGVPVEENSLGTLGSVDSSSTLRLGENEFGANHFHGLIDDVRIYNRVLS
ncbi:MAG TPA: LamG-like jellyroll fold domain-containing protein, partial [Candidatus Limnocylindria bacterium]|nr:LamG-like jellyroll fold domain-containing protein [Candidatus Limnocylindria bacterium]